MAVPRTIALVWRSRPAPSRRSPGERLISVEVPKATALYDSIRRLKLDVQTIAPIHGRRTTDVAELVQSWPSHVVELIV